MSRYTNKAAVRTAQTINACLLMLIGAFMTGDYLQTVVASEALIPETSRPVSGTVEIDADAQRLYLIEP
ncbi:MAG TPA: hypothetical protein VK978_02615 [Candidatus Saccharimonadales bacterium]|nr:hypothetical protein [Candidatus Saccharimonadales bacterium]